MKAHIISIGDELLIGQTLNTNASYLGERLSEINIDVEKVCTIGDEETPILEEFKNAFENSDIILVTGGLGPTHDDITRAAVAKFFNSKLIKNEEVLENIKNIFSKRGRKLSQINIDQSLVPELAEIIKNVKGTAPGYWIERENKIFIVMPGVPYEMKTMMEDQVLDRLKEKTLNVELVSKRSVLQTTGIPESFLFERLGNLDELLEGAKLAFLPSIFGVKLRLTVQDTNEEKAKSKLVEIEQKIRSKVGRFIFGKGEETLEEVVGRILKDRELKLAVAESCTGGLISSMITNISGSSTYFERGVVCYSNASKVEILKVDEDTIAEHGAVSQEVAMQMAEGVKSTSGSDIGLATTGIMGPTGATTEKPVGLVYIGYCDDKVCTAKKFMFGEERILNKQRTAQAALNLLRKYVLGISIDD
jgi:competence/damage-inducible protein CinA-like protein